MVFMEETLLQRPKKRLLISLLILSTFCLAAVFYAVWRISYLGLMELWLVLPAVVGIVFLSVVLLAFFGILNLVLAIKGWPSLHLFQKQMYTFINILFPTVVRLGSLFGVNRRQLEGSFIAVSNLLFSRRKIRVPAEKLLVVTPHCLQLASCPHKITRDPSNCKRCGGCNIGDLVKLSEEMGFLFFVATGGTLARQIIKQNRPKAVLAIACERDLMSGIQDVYPLPAVGVLNIRPNGPCYNTRVDMEEVKAELKKIVIPKDEVRD
ncbi:MAG: DUF116 domain-containing protein [Selenomonadaceae bacterium]|nr:DUF116 domain-containing protein [Selenomonadaceae bacterium]